MFPEPKTGNNGPELQKRRVRRIFIETAVEQRLLLLLSRKLVQNRVSWLWERKGKISRSQNKSVTAHLWTDIDKILTCEHKAPVTDSGLS